MTDKMPLIILAGPTAVGKTDLSIALAKAVNGEIISADSMQVYRYMDIGSAKVMPEEMEGVPHHLIDCYDPSEEFHVVEFQRAAKEAMKDIVSRGRIPILAGGTGFYVQALLRDIDFTETAGDPVYRQELEERSVTEGAEVLHRELATVDPESALEIHANNVKRVIRALEYYHFTGEKISDHNKKEKERKSPYNFLYLVLNRERSELYRRIDLRVDIMLEKGLLDEVKRLKEMGYHRGMVSMQGLGYKEILEYLAGNLCRCTGYQGHLRSFRNFLNSKKENAPVDLGAPVYGRDIDKEWQSQNDWEPEVRYHVGKEEQHAGI